MTEPNAGAPAPTSVTIASNSEMTFPTTNPSGQALTPKEQFQLRLQSPTWCKDAMIAGTPAAADKARLELAMAQAEARMMGEEFSTPADQEAARINASLEASRIRVPMAGEPITPELQARVADLQGWVGAAGFDADEGSNLLEMAKKLDSAPRADHEALAAAIDKSRTALEGALGAAFEPSMQAADKLLAEIEAERPGLMKFLQERPHLLTDPLLVNRFLSAARRRYGV